MTVGWSAAFGQAAASGGRFCVAAGIVLTACASVAAQGQGPDIVREARGHVVMPGVSRMRPVAGLWVTLHRVGRDSAGPIDSTRTDRDGRFRLRLRRRSADDAVYFLSASHAGIAYFSSPIESADSSDVEIAVFDTTSAPVQISVRGRHLVVAATGADESREIIEVYELSNDTSVTRVSRGDEDPTFTTTLPDGATDVRVGQGDISAEAVRIGDGRVRVLAPLAPGLKQLAYAYRIGGRAFPLSVPLGHKTDVLEVLLEDSGGSVGGAGLAEVAPVSTEGRTFRRFLAQDVLESGVVRVSLGQADRPRVSWVVITAAALAAAMVIALALALRRGTRRPAIAPPRRELPVDADSLAREIAELDARFETTPSPSDAERDAYQMRRAELKRRLTDALAEAARHT